MEMRKCCWIWATRRRPSIISLCPIPYDSYQTDVWNLLLLEFFDFCRCELLFNVVVGGWWTMSEIDEMCRILSCSTILWSKNVNTNDRTICSNFCPKISPVVVYCNFFFVIAAPNKRMKKTHFDEGRLYWIFHVKFLDLLFISGSAKCSSASLKFFECHRDESRSKISTSSLFYREFEMIHVSYKNISPQWNTNNTQLDIAAHRHLKLWAINFFFLMIHRRSRSFRDVQTWVAISHFFFFITKSQVNVESSLWNYIWVQEYIFQFPLL